MTQKQIEKRKIELAEKISNGETNQTLLKWYREEYGIEKSVFYQDYDSILDEVGDKYSEKLKRIATKWMMVLEKAMEGSMKEGQYSLISNQVAVLGKLAGISSDKVEHQHRHELSGNVQINYNISERLKTKYTDPKEQLACWNRFHLIASKKVIVVYFSSINFSTLLKPMTSSL